MMYADATSTGHHPEIPMPPTTQLNAQTMATQLTQAASTLRALSSNIRFLQANRSADKLQQVQSEAIVQLYDAVKQIQEALWPLPSLLIPDVQAAKDAAKSGAAAAQASAPLAAKLNAVTMSSTFAKRVP